MDYDADTKWLTIDLSKDDYQPEMLLAHDDVRSIHLKEYTEQIELPSELASFSYLDSLLIWGADTTAVYEPPVNLAKLTNIKTLILRNPTDLTKLSPMPNVECLDVRIQDPYRDIPVITSIFSNLKTLDLNGRHVEDGQLSSDIARFSKLEHLTLDSCGLTDLPPEFKQLTTLKSITMFQTSGTVMDTFPVVLCDLVNLEKLCFAHKINDLPESFSHFKALKYLDFSGAFNMGTDTAVANSLSPVVNIKPLPEMVGRLPALETLKLSNCGVIDISFLTGLTTLKKLKIGASGIPNCQGFSAFINLEELNLYYATALGNIDGLRGLPLKKLYLDTCRELKSIAGLDGLKELKELNINSSRNIKDLAPVYDHPSLQSLEASKSIIENWKQKVKYQQLPPIDTVIQALSSPDIHVFSSAVGHLKSYIDKNYHNGRNPLAGYFSCQEDDHEIVHLPTLEAGFEKHKPHLDVAVLIDLVDLSFREAGDDNYMITLLAIGEINQRQDSDGQIAVITIFNKACEWYEAGHRYWEITVLDQLIDDYFVSFSTQALIELLSNASGDLLNSNGGDGLDTLFISAFKHCLSNNEFSKLTEVFFKYQDRSIRYQGLEYFKTRQNEITSVLERKYQTLFQQEIDARFITLELQIFLESGEPKNISKLIRMLENGMPDSFFEENNKQIIQSVNELDLPNEDVHALLDFYLKKQVCGKLIAETLVKYIYPKGAEKVVQYLKSAELGKSYFIEEMLLRIIRQLNMSKASIEDIQPFREYLKSIKNYTQDEVYSLEVKALFLFISDRDGRDERVQNLDRIETLVLLAGDQIDTSDMYLLSNLWEIVGDQREQDYETVKRLTKILFKVVPKRIIIDILFVAVIAAVETNDDTWFNELIVYIPQKVHKDLLAYNLACGFAKFHHKDEMLSYVRRSLELGKTAAQFLNDNDFATYKDDSEFSNLLKEYE